MNLLESKHDGVRLKEIILTPHKIRQWRENFIANECGKEDGFFEETEQSLYILELFVKSHTSYSHPYLTYKELFILLIYDDRNIEDDSEPDDYDDVDLDLREEKYNVYGNPFHCFDTFIRNNFTIITLEMTEEWIREAERCGYEWRDWIPDMVALRRYIVNHGGAQTLAQIEYSSDPIELDPIDDEWVFVDYDEPIISSRQYIINIIKNRLSETNMRYLLFDA